MTKTRRKTGRQLGMMFERMEVELSPDAKRALRDVLVAMLTPMARAEGAADERPTDG